MLPMLLESMIRTNLCQATTDTIHIGSPHGILFRQLFGIKPLYLITIRSNRVLQPFHARQKIYIYLIVRKAARHQLTICTEDIASCSRQWHRVTHTYRTNLQPIILLHCRRIRSTSDDSYYDEYSHHHYHCDTSIYIFLIELHQECSFAFRVSLPQGLETLYPYFRSLLQQNQQELKKPTLLPPSLLPSFAFPRLLPADKVV